LFHGVSVAHGHDTATTIAAVSWLMLGFFVVPMVAMIGTALADRLGYRVVHFWITVVYSVLNFLHLAMDLTVQPIVWHQITLMIVLFGVGLCLNGVAFQWMRKAKHHPPRTLVFHS
jgi:nitrate/nitrite transporter NarK